MADPVEEGTNPHDAGTKRRHHVLGSWGCWLAAGLVGVAILLLAGFYMSDMWPASVTIDVIQQDRVLISLRPNHRVESIDTLRIYSEDDKGPIWAIGANESVARDVRVNYGEVPKNWEQMSPNKGAPTRLVRGQKYRIVVGYGYNYYYASSAASSSRVFEVK